MSPSTSDFDAILAERAEIDLITGQTYTFTVPRPDGRIARFLTRYGLPRLVVRQTDTYQIARPTMGKLCHLSRELLALDFDITQAEQMDTVERVDAMAKNSQQMSRIVAIMALPDDGHALNQQVGLLADRFMRTIDHVKLLELVRLINIMTDVGPFIISIGLLKAQNRPTQPTPIEKPAGQRGTTVSTGA